MFILFIFKPRQSCQTRAGAGAELYVLGIYAKVFILCQKDMN